MLSDIPTAIELEESAKRGIYFFIDNIINSYEDHLEEIEVSPIADIDGFITSIQNHKEWYLQLSLTILFNAMEVYLKSKIANESVYLLLNDLSQCKGNKSFYDMPTIAAQDLPLICENINNHTVKPYFNDTYQEIRKDRNKVIHLGAHNTNDINKKIIKYFFIAIFEMFGYSLKLTLYKMYKAQGLTKKESNMKSKSFILELIKIMRTFFPLEDALKSIFKVANIREWQLCKACMYSLNSDYKTIIVFSKTKSLCLSCGKSQGI